MNYNYIQIVQVEDLKVLVKKQITIGGQTDTKTGDTFLTDPSGQSFFCIPKQLFMLDKSKLKGMTSLSEMYFKAQTGRHTISVTPTMINTSKSQLTQLYDKDNDVTLWINSKFLGYFKGIKGVEYGYFKYRDAYMVCAYDMPKVLGVTVTHKPKI